MNIAFRVDASLQIGSGHVMRCLTLANAMRERGVTSYFLCREHRGHLVELIRAKGHVVYVLPADERYTGQHDTPHAAWLGATQTNDACQSATFLQMLRPAWLIVDHYALDATWERSLHAFYQSLMVIDDLADRNHHCDILLDQNWQNSTGISRYQSLLGFDSRQLLGPQYALLSPEYRTERLHVNARSGIVRNVLVFMSGSDTANITRLILKSLSLLDWKDIKIKVVTGINYAHYDALIAEFGVMKGWEILRSVTTLAPLMREADLMIGAGGSTNWERMCLGLPSVILSVASNQVKICELLAQEGCITYLGKSEDITCEDICSKISSLFNHPDVMREQSIKIMSMVDGLGVERVCSHLLMGR